MTDQTPTLEQAIQALAMRCDGAVTEDGVGFNGTDARFGRVLAEKIGDWTPRMRRIAWDMTQKYQVQLSHYGVEWAEIPEPPKEDSAEGRKAMKTHREKKYGPEAPAAVSFVDDHFEITFPYNPDHVIEVKKIPGRAFRKETASGRKFWKIPARSDSARGLEEFILKVEGFEVDDGVEEKIFEILGEALKAAELSRAEFSDFEVPGFRCDLRPFQSGAVEYVVVKKGRAIIGDEQGLGKTPEGLAVIHYFRAYPTLCIVPNSVKYHWKRCALNWLPLGTTVGVIEGSKLTAANYEALRCDVVIVNYDILGWGYRKLNGKRDRTDKVGHPTKMTEHLMEREFRGLIVDEIHKAKNHKAQRTIAIRSLAKRIPKDGGVVLGLSGTWILNRPQESISPLQIIGRLEEMGGFWNHLRNCGVYKGRFGLEVMADRDALMEKLVTVNERLREVCLIRRKKADVMKELPPKTRTVVPMAISNRREYNRAANDVRAYLKSQGKNLKWSAEHLVKIEVLKQLAVKGKFDGVVEWIRDFLESDQKLVVFAHHVAIQKKLQEIFPDAARIDADDDAEEQDRQAHILFQNPKGPQLMIASYEAGGEGFTLTAASNMAIIELGWTPTGMDQREDRIHRYGQDLPANYWYLMAEDSIEEMIATLIDSKRGVVAAMTDGEKGRVEAGSVQMQLMKLLAQAQNGENDYEGA